MVVIDAIVEDWVLVLVLVLSEKFESGYNNRYMNTVRKNARKGVEDHDIVDCVLNESIKAKQSKPIGRSFKYNLSLPNTQTIKNMSIFSLYILQ
jgi:hypothetical protein